MCIHPYLHVGWDFNDTVILTELLAAQSQLVQPIQIFDDEINEGREVFDVSLEVVSNISNNVMYRIQTTLCRIRESDRKLCCKICMYTFKIEIVRTLSLVLYLMKAQYMTSLQSFITIV